MSDQITSTQYHSIESKEVANSPACEATEGITLEFSVATLLQVVSYTT